MSDTLEVQIPFDGFYESIHSENIDREYESIIQYENGDPIPELEDELWICVSTDSYIPYAKAYAKAFAEFLKEYIPIELAFVGMSSPKEYNFGTDRIFGEISLDDAIQLVNACDKAALDKMIRTRFTSCDGFLSNYDNRLADWPDDITDWDHNQLGTALMCFLEGAMDECENLTYEVMEYMSDEAAYNAVWEDPSDDLVALSAKAQKIRDQRRKREE